MDLFRHGIVEINRENSTERFLRQIAGFVKDCLIKNVESLTDHANARVEHDEADPEALRSGGGGFEVGLNYVVNEVEALGTGEFADGLVVDWAVAAEGRKAGSLDEGLSKLFGIGLRQNGRFSSTK